MQQQTSDASSKPAMDITISNAKRSKLKSTTTTRTTTTTTTTTNPQTYKKRATVSQNTK